MPHSAIQFLSRHRVRVGLGATALAAVVGLVALGAFVAGGETTERRSGPALAVAVVAPVEPSVDPGSAMDVGDLTDGFDRAALERRAELTDETYLPPDAYVGEDWRMAGVERMPLPTAVDQDSAAMRSYRSVVDRISADGDRVRDALQDGSRSFGFDRPRPDFAAERAARWAAREAGDARPGEADDGSVAYTDVVQYSSE